MAERKKIRHDVKNRPALLMNALRLRLMACKSMEEYLDWYNLLDAEDQDMADVLQHIVILETMEEMLSEVSNQYADVRAYLKKFML